jgi:hypothetical protein
LAKGIGLVNFGVPSFLPGVEIDVPDGEGRMFALALLKAYPNTSIIIVYVLGTAIVALVMYRHHRSQGM